MEGLLEDAATEFKDPTTAARLAYERIVARISFSLVEPFEAYQHIEIDPMAAFFGSGGSARPEKVIHPSRGENNLVFKGFGATSPSQILFRGSNNVVFIGPYCDAAGAAITFTGSDCAIFIGPLSQISGAKLTAQGDGTAIFIGERTFISDSALVYNSDGHGIYSITTGERINGERDIVIGDHAYVGFGAKVNNGAIIEDDAIVLDRSVVSGRIESFCAYQGVPAAKVQTGVTWAPPSPGADTLAAARQIEDAAVAARIAIMRDRIAAFSAAATRDAP